jgi:capsular exopolysaccharide synthesis family protein
LAPTVEHNFIISIKEQQMEPGKLITREAKLIRAGESSLDHRVSFREVHGGDEFSFAEFWQVVRKRKWVIAGCVAVFLGLAILASIIMRAKYEAVSVIEINKENSDMLGLDDMTSMMGAGSDALDYNVALQTQANVLQSDTLALQVVNQLELDKREEFAWTPGMFDNPNVKGEASLPLEKAPHRRAKVLKVFHKHLTVKTVPGTRMIEIDYLNPDPVVAASVVNTLVADYLEQYFRTRYSATAQASDWLTKQLADLKDEVESSQKKLVDYQKKHGILGTDPENNVIMAKLEELNKQLTAAEANRILKQTVFELTKTGNAELISGVAGSSLISSGGGGSSLNNPLSLIQNLRAQEADLRVQYAMAATKYGSAYPKLVQMQNQLKEIKSAIQAEVDKVAARSHNDYIAALNSEEMLRASFGRQKDEANKLNNDAVQFTVLQHEVESSRDLYDGLLKKLKEAGVLSGLRSTNIIVVDPGRETATPVRPNVPLNLALGLMAGLLGGIALAFMVENMDNTVHTPDQVEAMMSLPSLGIIPDGASLRVNGDRRKFHIFKKTASLDNGKSQPAIAAPQSQLAEAYRSLRSSILLSNVDAPPKVILVTSALPQEGKTTTSINCAAVLAQQGARVLLVDADMRRPNIEKRLGLRSLGGLSTLLASNNGLQSPFVEHPDIPSLFILAAGTKPPYPAELLGSKRMSAVVDKWREDFDYVVIDSPPVLAVTDAVVLSTKADAVILVIRSGQTTRQSVLRARDVLHRASANITGILVNGVDLNSADHYYYSGYDYSSEYGQAYHEDVISKN